MRGFFFFFCAAFFIFVPRGAGVCARGVPAAWDFFKGGPAEDSVMLGLFSHHTSGRDREGTHNLIGLDFRVYSFGTFKNSHSVQTYYAGIGRELYERGLGEKFSFSITYRLMVMYGYEEQYPDLFGLVPAIIPMFGLNLNYFGVDFMVIPAGRPGI